MATECKPGGCHFSNKRTEYKFGLSLSYGDASRRVESKVQEPHDPEWDDIIWRARDRGLKKALAAVGNDLGLPETDVTWGFQRPMRLSLK